ncbi:1-acyl-sn-glycerol-3-phosphate acyltransferase [Acinetobacter calcoaceticus]|uniref:1-acyl-sn-glycerol-3-phosphate acyltransferase n=1 Tax=Acinetobacter calcoaceticus TaxID=471 RepID=A0A4R1XP09_ACICA|nr:1-acyl-sn-glycerol-3-phosphate acyltransferase [Acinetobacter calcoaceticus]
MSKPQPNQFPIVPPDQVPQRGTALSRKCFSQLYLKQGWRFEGELPNIPKAVAIMTPHTSNYDAWFGFLAILGLGVQLTVFGKASLFNTPLKHVFKWIGVMPVQRDSAQGLTQEIIKTIKAADRMWIGIAPEGTRKQAKKIKSGFYHIAHGADLPIVIFAFDYDHKVIRCMEVFYTTGNYEQDLEAILAIYKGNFSPKNAAWLSKPLQNLYK